MLPDATPRTRGLLRLIKRADDSSAEDRGGSAIKDAETAIKAAETAIKDAETGLANGVQLLELLGREIARSRRHGDRSTLVVFDVRVAGYNASSGAPFPPSPAPFVAEVLLSCIREADLVARLDGTHFVALLTECEREGARAFAERARTRIASLPYDRGDNNGHVYARAWAGYAPWDPSMTSPELYVSAAMAELERTRPGYEAEHRWFSGNVG